MLAYLAQSSARSRPSGICPGPLQHVAGLSCRLYLSFDLQMMSLWWSMCAAQDHLNVLAFLIISYVFCHSSPSLTQMLVLLSLYVMSSVLLSILVCGTSRLCACLVTIHVYAPYTQSFVVSGRCTQLISAC